MPIRVKERKVGSNEYLALARQGEVQPMKDNSSYPGLPRWLKISGTIAIVLLLAFVVLHLTGIMGGMHGMGGPGHHMQP